MGFEIPVDVDYFGHPKTLKLIAVLNRAEADVYPLRLWRWAASYARDGRLPGDVSQIEVAIGWRGRSGRLHSALVEAGFIEKDGFTLHSWSDHIGRAIAIYESKKRKQREKYDREKGILPEEFRQSSGSLPPILDTLEGKPRRGGDKAPPTTPQSAPPAVESPLSPEILELREVERTVAAFGFCATPGIRAKALAIADLRRQGVPHLSMRAIAKRQDQKDFYEIIQSIRKGKASPAFTPSAPKPKACRTCAGTGNVADLAKSTPEITAWKPCPDCQPNKATG